MSDVYVRDMPYSVRKQIAVILDVEDEVDGNDCRKLASLIGMSNDKIKLIWKGRGRGATHPTEQVLDTWGTSNQATVGRLREYFVEMNHGKLIEILHNAYPNLAQTVLHNNSQPASG